MAKHRFANRSCVVEETVREMLERIDRAQLARECAKLDPQFEQALANEGLNADLDQLREY